MSGEGGPGAAGRVLAAVPVPSWFRGGALEYPPAPASAGVSHTVRASPSQLRKLASIALLLLCLLAPLASAQGGADEQEPERPIAVDVQVEGLRYNDPLRIAARLGYRVGAPLPLEVTEAQRMLFRETHIVVESVDFDIVEGGVVVKLKMLEAPVDLDPQFVGNTKFDEQQLREWALLDDRVEVFTDEVEKIRDRLTEAYKRQGYHFIEVDAVMGDDQGGRQEIIFQIKEGPKVYVKSVQIRGNDAIPDDGFFLWKRTMQKRAQLQTKGKGLFAWWGHRYIEEVLEADRIAIAQVYRDRGHMDVVVDAELEFTPERDGVHVVFRIDEGPLYSVRSISIEAYEVETVEVQPGFTEQRDRRVDLIIPEEELKELLALEVDGPFDQSRVGVDVRTLLDRYGRDGHIDAASFDGLSGTAGWRFLGLDVVPDYENRTVDVVYKIQQGRPFYLRFLEISGNQDTKDRVIRRLFSQLEGDLVDAQKVRNDLRRVRGTQYFDDQFARGTHPPPAVNYKTVEGEPDLVDIVVSVEEGRTINANLSGGVASDQGLVGIISVSISNFDIHRLPRSFWGTFGEVYRKEAFTGDGETFGVDLSPGSEINYSRIFYQHPDIFRRHFDPIGVVSEFQLRDRIFRSHDESRSFFRFAMTRAFAQGDWQASLGVRWQDLRTDDLDPNDFLPRTLRNSEGEETFVGLTGSVSVNKLDNRRLPRTGYTGRWTNTFYSRGLGSDRNLWKSELNFDRYFHLGKDPNSAAPGIYLGLGGGVAVPIDEPRGSVNYGERFFFGGARIGRGFRFRGIGPYEGEFPLGGETYARSTLEYRFPLYAQTVPGTSRRREVFRGSFFMDAVVLDPSAYELDLEEARVSAGFALGLIDPFPVTFSFGWPLRSEDEDERQVFAFSLTFR